MKTRFKPIDPDYYEMFDSEITKNVVSRVHYFVENMNPLEKKSRIVRIVSNERNEEFLEMKSNEKIRIDRIIAINGKPGPAYDEYDSFANVCLDCKGDMEN